MVLYQQIIKFIQIFCGHIFGILLIRGVVQMQCSVFEYFAVRCSVRTEHVQCGVSVVQ